MSRWKRKKTSCPFASSKKPKKQKSGINKFSVEQARSLALSDRGLYYNQDKWLFEDTNAANEASNMSAKCVPLQLHNGTNQLAYTMLTIA